MQHLQDIKLLSDQCLYYTLRGIILLEYNTIILFSKDVARCNGTLVNLFNYISNRLHGYSFNSFELGSYRYLSFTLSARKIHRNKNPLDFTTLAKLKRSINHAWDSRWRLCNFRHIGSVFTQAEVSLLDRSHQLEHWKRCCIDRHRSSKHDFSTGVIATIYTYMVKYSIYGRV